MWFFGDTYERLAKEKDLVSLARFGCFDERVYEVVHRHGLIEEMIDALPDAHVAKFLANGQLYSQYNDAVVGKKFIRICSLLQRYETVEQGGALSTLVGNCALNEAHRLELFNFSETCRHLIVSRSPFAERGGIRLLSYMFIDDFMSDAVAHLQYKTDILNHVNRIFVKNYDFWSWRFSVRVMSSAGGYNEDRLDVDKTERLCRAVTQAVPEFLLYFTLCYFYARVRHYPQRVHGVVPKWLARHRALFSAWWCGLLGVFVNTYSEWKVFRHKLKYEFRDSQEMRRRRAAERRGIEYRENSYFDSLEGVSRHVFSMQMKSYMMAAGAIGLCTLPLPRVNFPKFVGDVPFRYPFVPRFFPMVLGMPCASRCTVPFVVAPFCVGTLFTKFSPCSLYDRYINVRFWFWKRKHAVSDDEF